MLRVVFAIGVLSSSGVAAASGTRTLDVTVDGNLDLSRLQSQLSLLKGQLGVDWVVADGSASHQLRVKVSSELESLFIVLTAPLGQEIFEARFCRCTAEQLSRAAIEVTLELVRRYERSVRPKTGLFCMCYPEDLTLRLQGGTHKNGFVSLDPGYHTVELHRPGRSPETREVLVPQTGLVIIEVFLKRVMGPPSSEAKPAPSSEAKPLPNAWPAIRARLRLLR